MMVSRTPKFSWREQGLVLLLLLIGAALRLWDAGQIPSGLYHDEAQNGLDALRVLSEGDLPLYFAANNGREPFYIYLITLSVGLLGRSPLAIRLPSFFVGTLTLAALYDLGRVLWGRRVGRWALAVLAVTFWHIHLSRVGFRAVMLPLFTAFFLAQCVRAIKSRRLGHWIAAGALYGAAWYTYMAVRFTPIVLAALIGYALLCHKDRAKLHWKGALAFSAAAWVILLPLGLYTLCYPEIVMVRTGHVSILNPDINQGDFWGTLARHTWRTLEMFFVQGDRIWRHNLAGRPIWDPALGLAFVIGLGVAMGRFRRDAGAAMTVIWTALMLLPTLLAEDAPHFLRGVGILPVAALFPALGLVWIEDQVARIPARAVRNLPLVLWAVGLGSTTYDYFTRYASAPLAYHWFESGPVELAGQINALIGEGWDGREMLHGPDTERTITIAPQLWKSWDAFSFLVPETRIRFLPVTEPPDVNKGMAFVVWPYRDWAPGVLPSLPHPAQLSVTQGPQAQGDKDAKPFDLAFIVRADPDPAAPAALTRFEKGITLCGVTMHAEGDKVTLTLCWQADSPLEGPYTVFVHYLRESSTLTQHDGQPGYGYLPTTFWEPGDVILDAHTLSGVTPDPARDTLRIGLYRSDTGEALSVLDEAGNPAGTWIDLPLPQGH